MAAGLEWTGVGLGMAKSLTYKEAVRFLENQGFVLVKQKRHIKLQRGLEVVTLPSSGHLSPWLTQLVLKKGERK